MIACLVLFFLIPTGAAAGNDKKELLAVTIENFPRAESHLYFNRRVRSGAFGKINSYRNFAPIDNQTVVRMNRDTLYSSGVFDLDAAPVTITLPDTGKRFMSMQVVNEDHYTIEVVYAPGTYTYDRDKVGTRYTSVIIRTLADPKDPADMKQAHSCQDGIQVDQKRKGKWEIPDWDTASQKEIRQVLKVLGSKMAGGPRHMFGNKNEVDPVHYLIGVAVGWGGSPNYAAVYRVRYPKENDGQTAYQVTVKDVPVDGFWSISLYNADGYFVKNDMAAYSVNNLTALKNEDGSVTVHFGGDKSASNYLPIMPGWNYTVRMFRPRPEIVSGKWTFPEAKKVE